MSHTASFSVLVSCFLAYASAALHDEIYYTIAEKNTDGVARLLNIDGQIGASSNSVGGDVGALYRISSTDDVEAFNKASGKSYVALISQPMLASSVIVEGLLGQSKLKGLLIYDVDTPTPWSTQCTLDGFNPIGGGYGDEGKTGLHWTDLGVPAFLIRDDDNETIHNKYNQSESVDNPNGRTLGIRLNFFMWAKSNAKSCLRRTNVQGFPFCQALTANNIFGTLRPYTGEDAEVKDTILISSQLDAVSLFHDNSYGASAQGASIAAMIALARMTTMGVNMSSRSAASHNILFAGFQGEQFENIGSSAFYEGLRHELASYHFPSYQNQIEVSDIKYHIELGQMMSTDSSDYYVHHNKSQQLANTLSTTYGFKLPTNESKYFPKTATAAAFRRWNDSWTHESVLIGDFDDSFGNASSGNHYLYTRQDDAVNVGITNETDINDSRIVNLCTAMKNVADFVRDTSGLPAIDDAAAAMTDCQTVTLELLHMLLIDGSASVNFSDYTVSLGGEALASTPINRYVFGETNHFKAVIEQVVRWHLGAALRNDSQTTQECVNSSINIYSNASNWRKLEPVDEGLKAVATVVGGDEGEVPCWTTTVFTMFAQSPAFTGIDTIDDDLAKRYSTWTESTWDSAKVEVFLLQDNSEAYTILGGGIAYSFVCILIVWQATKRCGGKVESTAEE